MDDDQTCPESVLLIAMERVFRGPEYTGTQTRDWQPRMKRVLQCVRENDPMIEALRTEIERLRTIVGCECSECQADEDRAAAEYAALQKDAQRYREIMADVHTCGPTCRKTPVCAERADLREEIERLRAELERERMRLASCGVVAMANTPESAARARNMHPDYRSASCDDVARVVDSEMSLRAENAELLTDLDRVLTTLRYLIGIAERGEGRPMTDEESAESFVLGYVKRVEVELAKANGQINRCVDQNKYLESTISRLLRYAYHEEECAVMTCCGDLPPCDCGYDELMKELEEVK